MITVPLEDLVRSHQDEIYRHLVRVCHGSREDAEDALAEAILKAYQALDTLQREESFRPWLQKIAVRVCYRLRRRKPLMEVAEGLGVASCWTGGAAGSDPSMEAEQTEFRRSLDRLIESLPDGHREIYSAVEIEGRPLEELLPALNITKEAAKSRLRRARVYVRSHLDDLL